MSATPPNPLSHLPFASKSRTDADGQGRALSYKTFFMWLFVSLYQGSAIFLASLFLFETEFLNVVAISFSALIFNELIMVALEITTW